MKLFIWDFHGTLEKNNEEIVLATTNKALQRDGYSERMTATDVEKLYGAPWYKFFEHILPHATHEEHLKLVETCYVIQSEQRNSIFEGIKLNDCAEEVLRAIAAAHDQIVISNSKPEHIPMFLNAAGIMHFFPKGKYFGVHGTREKLPILKEHVLDDYLKGKRFEGIVAIGDSCDDVSFKPKGYTVRSYLYTHPHREFRNCEATYKIRDLREILKEI